VSKQAQGLEFFRKLGAIERFADVIERERYVGAPRDWSLVITDVMGSTQAIEQGRYRDVNALGVASIVAVTNSLAEIEIPFVFGGDGATLLVPNEHLESVERALRSLRKLATESFELTMRAGVVPIALLYASGYEVLVAKFRASRHVTLALFEGDGLAQAERLVKDPEEGTRFFVSDSGPAEGDFTGFECRWRPIENRHGLIMALIVASIGLAEERAEIFREVLATLDGFTTKPDEGCPLASSNLRLAGVMSEFPQEAKIRSGTTAGAEYRDRRRRARTAAFVARVCQWTGLTIAGFHAETYRNDMIQSTDFRKFDGALRMVLDVTPEQYRAIVAALQKHKDAGKIAFGMHVSNAALMTCLVRDYAGNHVHFIDGADGGYALAAKKLKQQLLRAD
jgi:hypothetical protein